MYLHYLSRLCRHVQRRVLAHVLGVEVGAGHTVAAELGGLALARRQTQSFSQFSA